MNNDAIEDAWANLRQRAAHFAHKNGKKLPPIHEQQRSSASFKKALEDSSGKKATQEFHSGRKASIKETAADGRAFRRVDFMPSSMGAIIKQEMNNEHWKTEIAAALIINEWAELVGDNIAAHTKVEAFKDKKIYIVCDSAAWAINLRLMQRQILQGIAKKIGHNIVEALDIREPAGIPTWKHGRLRVKGRGPRDTYD